MSQQLRPQEEAAKKGVSSDLQGRSNLLISFGGGKGGLGVPVFEFYKSIAHLNCDKIFLRDFRQAYYQKGVDEDIDHIESLIDYLKKVVEAGNYKKIICIGNSMGGYAAMLFGCIINADRVISFVLQTLIDLPNLIRHSDYRAITGAFRIYFYRNNRPEYYDLRKYLLNLDSYKTQMKLFFCPSYTIDKIHCERMLVCDGVELVEVDEGGHDLVKVLKKRGALKTVLEEAVYN
ncbi:MAG: hypothetical protein KDC44_03440 [Phaeodactylibacter sp.]|nr:hypothetical protein [Phaeodactylibacter sp.]